MAKADSNIFYNTLAGCAHPPVSSVAPFAITATFTIYEAGSYFTFDTDGCIQKPVYHGTLREVVDLSGVLPLFLSSEGIKYDYPALVLDSPTIAYIVASCVVNGATVNFSWYQYYDEGSVPPPGYMIWAVTDGPGMSFTQDGEDWLVPVDIVSAGGGIMISNDSTILKYDNSQGYFSVNFGASWVANADITGSNFGAWIEDRFWLVESPNIKYSFDCITWVILPLFIFGGLTVIGGRSGLLIVGDNAGRIRVSFDNGDNFGDVINIFNGNYVTTIGTDGTRVVLGSSAGQFAYTDNGIDFFSAITAYNPPGDNFAGVSRIIWGKDRWVATSPNLNGGQSSYSLNAEEWFIATGTVGFKGYDVAYSNAYGQDLYVSVGEVWTIKTSTDGENWEDRDNNFDSRGTITSVIPRPEQA